MINIKIASTPLKCIFSPYLIVLISRTLLGQLSICSLTSINFLSCTRILGQFGNGVLSYFIFLRWLFFLDLALGLIWFGFLCIPEFLLADKNIVSADYATFNVSQSIANTTTGASIYCSPDYIANTTSETNLFIVIISGRVSSIERINSFSFKVTISSLQ